MPDFSPPAPRNLKNVFILTHRSRIAVDRVRADSTGARFEESALDAAEATDRFSYERGGVGAGVVAEDLAPGVEDTDRDGMRE